MKAAVHDEVILDRDEVDFGVFEFSQRIEHTLHVVDHAVSFEGRDFGLQLVVRRQVQISHIVH